MTEKKRTEETVERSSESEAPAQEVEVQERRTVIEEETQQDDGGDEGDEG